MLPIPVPMLVVAQAVQPSLFGWYLGMAIGAVVVLVVVVVVASILSSAARIAEQAGMATEALDAAYRNTLPLWDVASVNRSARGILADARTAREALGG